MFPAVHVILGTLDAEADVLIGMDIIGAGDFALTSPKGKLQFTFRIPSQADIDFVRDDEILKAKQSGASRSKGRKKKKKNS